MARNHVSNSSCLTQEQATQIEGRHLLMCSINAYPTGLVTIFTSPDLGEEYVDGIGNAPPDYLDMAVDRLVTVGDVQFLCGRAWNTNGYALVRNTPFEGDVAVETDWCILSQEAKCELREPGMLTAREPIADIPICQSTDLVEEN